MEGLHRLGEVPLESLGVPDGGVGGGGQRAEHEGGAVVVEGVLEAAKLAGGVAKVVEEGLPPLGHDGALHAADLVEGAEEKALGVAESGTEKSSSRLLWSLEERERGESCYFPLSREI